MGRMAGMRRLVATLVTVTLTATALAGCTDDSSTPPEPGGGVGPQSAALRITTLGTVDLDEETRARVESEVSDVLAEYVSGSFLGDYPRTDFVQGLADFTTRAGGLAAEDLELVTGARFKDASAVWATQLDAELAFLVIDGQVDGVTAWVDFDFQVDSDDGTGSALLTGALNLDRRDGRWVVFGYRLMRDDSNALPAEAVT
jgi:hypothetical protein